ncbi:DUF2382 domain-containing protein [Lewinella sp. 4G2]|uniref:DUF2382 domain-containing protein n=1 Tax=Lewinella sp. 4G2 TaxID=1803372 RepID=UPI0018D2DF0C|nr:DUF2382 domain-containing protein [Lewinella sp. 4G2]
MTDKQQFNLGEQIVPVIKEELKVGSVVVKTGTVTVDRKINYREVEVPLTSKSIQYREERIPRNIIIQEAPSTRREGNRLIIPVVREEEVIVKRLVLVEEIHLIEEEISTTESVSVELREDQVTVERKPV